MRGQRRITDGLPVKGLDHGYYLVLISFFKKLGEKSSARQQFVYHMSNMTNICIYKCTVNYMEYTLAVSDSTESVGDHKIK